MNLTKASPAQKIGIRQRLMYSFDFTESQALVELDFLFRNGVFVLEDFYVYKQCRIGQTKTLTRQQKKEIHAFCRAIFAEDYSED